MCLWRAQGYQPVPNAQAVVVGLWLLHGLRKKVLEENAAILEVRVH
jgi:hypothetical protein